MKVIRPLVTFLLVCACHHKDAEGPFESAGKGLDRATDKTGHALSKAATTTGAAVEKAGQATGKAFGKVGEKLEGKSPNSSGAPAAAPSASAP